ncbi:MAG: hypothetical protein JO129_00080 [Candidatus Dependentiae bacterium]|nr:hypothetical protein [Candidatus Dependentiae bacterium]
MKQKKILQCIAFTMLLTITNNFLEAMRESDMKSNEAPQAPKISSPKLTPDQINALNAATNESRPAGSSTPQPPARPLPSSPAPEISLSTSSTQELSLEQLIPEPQTSEISLSEQPTSGIEAAQTTPQAKIIHRVGKPIIKKPMPTRKPAPTIQKKAPVKIIDLTSFKSDVSLDPAQPGTRTPFQAAKNMAGNILSSDTNKYTTSQDFATRIETRDKSGNLQSIKTIRPDQSYEIVNATGPAVGKISEKRTANGSITTNTYDENGMPKLSVTIDPNGHKITNNYNPDGSLQQTIEFTPNSARLTNNETTKTTTYKNGKPSTSVTRDYTVYKNIISTQEFGDDGKSYKTTNKNGQVIETSTVDSIGKRVTITYKNPKDISSFTIESSQDPKNPELTITQNIKGGNVTTKTISNSKTNATTTIDIERDTVTTILNKQKVIYQSNGDITFNGKTIVKNNNKALSKYFLRPKRTITTDSNGTTTIKVSENIDSTTNYVNSELRIALDGTVSNFERDEQGKLTLISTIKPTSKFIQVTDNLIQGQEPIITEISNDGTIHTIQALANGQTVESYNNGPKITTTTTPDGTTSVIEYNAKRKATITQVGSELTITDVNGKDKKLDLNNYANKLKNAKNLDNITKIIDQITLTATANPNVLKTPGYQAFKNKVATDFLKDQPTSPSSRSDWFSNLIKQLLSPFAPAGLPTPTTTAEDINTTTAAPAIIGVEANETNATSAEKNS